MLHQEKKTETKTVVLIIQEWYTCDICQDKIGEGSFDIREGRVLLKIGSSYPEGGSATEIRADICEKCFVEKLVPWLESQGVEMKTKEVEW